MTTLRKIIGTVAMCAMAVILTGCDDDDNSGDGSPAPSTLRGRTYNLADSGAGGTVTFDSGADNYSLTREGTTETGSFQATRSGDVWTVITTDSTGTTTSTLTLTFTGSNTGTYTYDRPDAEPSVVSGSFAGSGNGSTTSTGTSTSTGTDTGTSTSTGTDTGTSTSTGTTTGTGTVPAPATLTAIIVRTETGGIGANSVYSVALSGGPTGTFTASNTDGEAVGSGTYVYTPNGNLASLRLNYSTANNDYDDMNLVFTQPPGGQPNPYTGRQSVDGTIYDMTGTFTY